MPELTIDTSRLAEVATQIAESWWGAGSTVVTPDEFDDHPHFHTTDLPRLSYRDANDEWVETDLFFTPDGDVTRRRRSTAPMSSFAQQFADVLRDKHGVTCIFPARANDLVAVYPLGDGLFLQQNHPSHDPLAVDLTRLWAAKAEYDYPLMLAYCYGGVPGDPGRMMSGECTRDVLDRVVRYNADVNCLTTAEKAGWANGLRDRFLRTDCTFADAWALLPGGMSEDYEFYSVTIDY